MLDPASVNSRSNTDSLDILYVLQRMELSASERMALVHRIVANWDRSTVGSVGRYSADRVLETHYDNGYRRPGMPLRVTS